MSSAVQCKQVTVCRHPTMSHTDEVLVTRMGFPLSLPAKSSQSPMEAVGNYHKCSEHRWGKEQPMWEARRGPDKAKSRCKCATCSVDKSTQPIGNRDKQLLPLSPCTQPEDSPAFLIARQSPSMLAFFPWRPLQYFFFPNPAGILNRHACAHTEVPWNFLFSGNQMLQPLALDVFPSWGSW